MVSGGFSSVVRVLVCLLVSLSTPAIRSRVTSTVSSVLEGGKRRHGFGLGRGGVPLASSYHPSASEESLDSHW